MATNVLERAQEQVIERAIEEGFITDDTIAIDATHFEARDQAPPKQHKEKPAPKKRGRKTRAEREQWLQEQAEKEANRPLYDKKIEVQLTTSLTELRTDVPRAPPMGREEKQRRKKRILVWLQSPFSCQCF